MPSSERNPIGLGALPDAIFASRARDVPPHLSMPRPENSGNGSNCWRLGVVSPGKLRLPLRLRARLCHAREKTGNRRKHVDWSCQGSRKHTDNPARLVAARLAAVSILVSARKTRPGCIFAGMSAIVARLTLVAVVIIRARMAIPDRITYAPT